MKRRKSSASDGRRSSSCFLLLVLLLRGGVAAVGWRGSLLGVADVGELLMPLLRDSSGAYFGESESDDDPR